MTQAHPDFRTFLLVAQTQSFTKAAAQLGVSRAAVSHGIIQLEHQLGIRLFQRTTRKVSLTTAGEQLHRQLAPLFNEMDLIVSQVLGDLDRLQGSLRITGTYHAITVELWEKFERFRQQYPRIALELHSEIRFTDIVAERFDAGIRMGEMVAQDMVAVKVSGPMTMACIATPSYWEKHGKPDTPADLSGHECLRQRLPTHGGLLDWHFKATDGKPLSPLLSASFISNNELLLLHACRQGKGVFWVERSFVAREIADGSLQSVLDDWALSYPPYYLYYPHRNTSPLLNALVDTLREP